MTDEEFSRVEEMFRALWEQALIARDAAQEVLDLKQKFSMELTQNQIKEMQAKVKRDD